MRRPGELAGRSGKRVCWERSAWFSNYLWVSCGRKDALVFITVDYWRLDCPRSNLGATTVAPKESSALPHPVRCSTVYRVWKGRRPLEHGTHTRLEVLHPLGLLWLQAHWWGKCRRCPDLVECQLITCSQVEHRFSRVQSQRLRQWATREMGPRKRRKVARQTMEY